MRSLRAYLGPLKVLKANLLLGSIIIMLVVISALALGVLCMRMGKAIRRIYEVLYGGLMGRWEMIFAMVYAMVRSIIALILLLFG
ncbi:MAG: hypothetical protein DRN15_06280 [Thermoprotei archaeon]|nr:MAG: hypothetical protein DRN15_06280 [Thermoprotei archaeon]